VKGAVILRLPNNDADDRAMRFFSFCLSGYFSSQLRSDTSSGVLLNRVASKDGVTN